VDSFPWCLFRFEFGNVVAALMRDTSIASYRKIEAEGLLGHLQWEVYKILFENGPLTQGETWDRHFRAFQRHSIAPRFAELETAGVIRSIGERDCGFSGINSMVWDVTSAMPKKKLRKVILVEKAKTARRRYLLAKERYKLSVEAVKAEFK